MPEPDPPALGDDDPRFLDFDDRGLGFLYHISCIIVAGDIERFLSQDGPGISPFVHQEECGGACSAFKSKPCDWCAPAAFWQICGMKTDTAKARNH